MRASFKKYESVVAYHNANYNYSYAYIVITLIAIYCYEGSRLLPCFD